LFLVYLVFNSTLGNSGGDPEYMRLLWGGLSVLWGPRHLYAAIPFLAIGLLAFDWQRPALRTLAGALLLVSGVVNVLGTMFSDVMMSTNALGPELKTPIAYVGSLVRLQGPRVPLLASHGVAAPVQWVVVLALAALTSFVFWRELRGRPRGLTDPAKACI
jgi:hypothetical protein